MNLKKGDAVKTLYLHGLGSSSRSNTAESLRALGVALVAPDYAPQHYEASMQALTALVESERPDRIIGTSMGGYYALKLFPRFDLPTVAVNPCYDPAQLLTPCLSQPAWDYASDTPIAFNQAMLDAFEPVILPDEKELLHVVIGRNDEVIAAEGQRVFCRKLGIYYVETDWGHRVEDVELLLDIGFK